METTWKFTLEELGKFDGKKGRQAYVAYKGGVYDVTDSSQWLEGDHWGHAAGEDLTEQMEIAPTAKMLWTKTIRYDAQTKLSTLNTNSIVFSLKNCCLFRDWSTKDLIIQKLFT
jgi:predicted heme/steroid binding protein